MKHLFLIFLFLICVSCKKERAIHIIAKNPVTGARYEGLTYYVVEHRTAGGGEKSKTIATGSLNDNGEVALNLKISKNYSYGVRVVEPANTCYNKQISQSFGSQYDVDGTFTFEFAECAYLKLNINNINCQGSADNMRFRSKQSYTEWQSFSGDRFGCYSYLSPDYFQVPAGWRIYNWVVTRNGLETEYTDSIFLGAGEQGVFNMNYKSLVSHSY